VSHPTRIGFSTPRGFNPVSWIVRKLTGSVCSHAFFIYWDLDYEADIVMEAHELGFRHVPLSHFVRQNEIVASFVPRADINAGVKWVAMEYLGDAYDFGGLLGAAFVLLGRWLKKKWNNPLANPKHVFCSEAVVYALQRAHYPGASEMVPRDTTPQDLLTFFVKEGATPVTPLL
jgi:hypothetical protein